MEFFLLYLIVIVIILFCLSIHELGHFFASIIFKINVKEVSIGVGPRIYTWRTKGNVNISLRWFPIMAYVMTDSHLLRDIYKDNPEDKNYFFYMQAIPKNKKLLEDAKYWQYLIIMFAGVFVNIIFFFLMWLICFLTFKATGASFVNPFSQIGSSFVAIGNNFILNTHFEHSGSIFGQIIKIGDKMTPLSWTLTFLNMLMTLNLMLAILNIIPLPPLDGYKMATSSYTKISKQKLNSSFEVIFTLACLLVLFWIFISPIVVDILPKS